MKNKFKLCCIILLATTLSSRSQTIKILFDASKAETAGNADWIIDADLHNLGYTNGPAVVGQGDESNAGQFPNPAQSSITTSTTETYWNGALSNWGIDCVKQGYEVETLPYNGEITDGSSGNQQDLSNYDVFIVCEPNIVFTESEKTAILNFVQNGGGLFMVSDHDQSDRNGDGWDSPHIWNDLMTNNSVQTNPFGMSFDYENFSETSTNIPLLPGDSILHGPIGDVTEVQWSNGTSITIDTSQNSSVKGVIYKTGSLFGSSDIMCAYAHYGNGKVAALGDSSPCDDGTGDSNDQLYNGYTSDANGNHRLLLMNATIWLASPNAVATGTFQMDTIVKNISGYPDPATDYFTVDINPSISAPINFTWYDCSGKRISDISNYHSEPMSHHFTFNTSNIPDGIYCCTIAINHELQTIKVIVNH